MNPSSDELKWLGVDFDGTLCYSEPPEYEPTYAIKGAVESMQILHDKGWKLVIFTARPWSEYKVIEDWLISWNIPFREIICGKPLFHRLIDDRNIAFKGDWEQVLTEVEESRPVDKPLVELDII